MGDDSHVIVAFTKDWDDVPTCTTHILREMGKTVPVLWVGSIGTRKPSAVSVKDLRRIVKRIWCGLLPPEHKENRLYVLHPLLIPKATSRWAVALNRLVLRRYVLRFMRMMENGPHGNGADCESIPCGRSAAHRGRFALPCEAASDGRAVGRGVSPGGGRSVWSYRGHKSAAGAIEYWCFVPNAVDLLPERKTAAKRGDKIVYYVADDWTAFHNLDGAWMKAKEEALVGRADCIFAVSEYLVEKLRKACARMGRTGDDLVVHMPHGVDHAWFEKALDKSVALPPELQGMAGPIIGFYGNLHPWVDFGLIEQLAVARPSWHFVLIGEDYGVPESLQGCPNVHLLGRREHGVLVDYCRGFDAAIIPYDMGQARMESVNPVKTKELLSAGVAVVAAAVPAW